MIQSPTSKSWPGVQTTISQMACRNSRCDRSLEGFAPIPDAGGLELKGSGHCVVRSVHIVEEFFGMPIDNARRAHVKEFLQVEGFDIRWEIGHVTSVSRLKNIWLMSTVNV